MKNKKSNSKVNEETLLEALLATGKDFAEEEQIDEFLVALGVEPDNLASEFAAHLEKRAFQNKTSEQSEATASRSVLNAVRTQEQKRKSSKIIHKNSDKQVQLKTPRNDYWTNTSVLLLAQGRDPVETIIDEAKKAILDFSEVGGDILSIDPFLLAKSRGVKIVPREEIRDSRTTFTDGKFVIEFNPNRPRARTRYSICHELTHTFFPDCHKKVRYRATHEEMAADDWQLEMLCNIGAGELLMPFQTLPEINYQNLTAENLMQLRKKYEVSTEALFLRIARVTSVSCCVFSASRKEAGGVYRIDYTRPSSSWQVKIPNGFTLPKTSKVKNCTAIGHTDFGVEQWTETLGEVRIECVGIPPYPSQFGVDPQPNQTFPRVMGVIKPVENHPIETNKIKYVRGDATAPRADGNYRIITHIVNNQTPNWGGMFAGAVKRKFPAAQTDFQDWAIKERSNLGLGNIHFVEVAHSLGVVTMISQQGYGNSKKPRLRYAALKVCLDKLATFANTKQASIHMPRIGSGQAGGDWRIIEELIEDSLCNRSIKVYVYDLPNAEIKVNQQGRFKFSEGQKGLFDPIQ